jgi:hypothetical protein
MKFEETFSKKHYPEIFIVTHFFVDEKKKSFLESGWNNCYYFDNVEPAFYEAACSMGFPV